MGLSVLDLGPMYATERQTSDKSIGGIIRNYGVGMPIMCVI